MDYKLERPEGKTAFEALPDPAKEICRAMFRDLDMVFRKHGRGKHWQVRLFGPRPNRKYLLVIMPLKSMNTEQAKHGTTHESIVEQVQHIERMVSLGYEPDDVIVLKSHLELSAMTTKYFGPAKDALIAAQQEHNKYTVGDPFNGEYGLSDILIYEVIVSEFDIAHPYPQHSHH